MKQFLTVVILFLLSFSTITGCALKQTDNLDSLMELAESTSAQVSTRGFYGLTGGEAANTTPLDGKSVHYLTNGDMAMGWDDEVFRTYKYSTTETAAQSEPKYIIPYDNATGTGVWVLQCGYLQGVSGSTPHVLNLISLTITDGTDPDTIKCSVLALYNGTAITAVDNIGKDETSGDFTLESDGTFVYLNTSGFPGNLVRVLMDQAVSDNGTDIRLSVGAGGGSIAIYAYAPGDSGTFLDFTTLVNTGQLRSTILFVTDE